MSSLKNFHKSERIYIEEYALSFEDSHGPSFSFSCDKEGNLIDVKPWSRDVTWPHGIRIWGWNSLNWAVSEYCTGELTLVIRDYSRYYREPAYGNCEACNRVVELYEDYGHGIECDCGAIYNMSGNRLAPRSQWEDYYDEDDYELGVPYNQRFGYARDDY